MRDWVTTALPFARRAVTDVSMRQWHVCEGTWFVGVDALPNDVTGAIGESGPLRGAAVDLAHAHIGVWPDLHPAQVSVTYPGYPKPREGESDKAFGYRLNRDAAHVDGIRGEGTTKRRFVREPHAFILGLPLTLADAGAAPLVVWPRSHVILRDAFRAVFHKAPRADWPDLEVTELYQTLRKQVFDTCQRVVLSAAPGEAVLLHRHILHGVAPWAKAAKAGTDGRMVAYFRPEMPGGLMQWLDTD